MMFMFCTACPAAPLDEIVLDTENHHGVTTARAMPGHATHIGATHTTCIGMTAGRHDIYEGLFLVAALVDFLQIHIRTFEARIQGCVYAAQHRN